MNIRHIWFLCSVYSQFLYKRCLWMECRHSWWRPLCLNFLNINVILLLFLLWEINGANIWFSETREDLICASSVEIIWHIVKCKFYFELDLYPDVTLLYFSTSLIHMHHKARHVCITKHYAIDVHKMNFYCFKQLLYKINSFFN